jgi:hypothetical protein
LKEDVEGCSILGTCLLKGQEQVFGVDTVDPPEIVEGRADLTPLVVPDHVPGDPIGGVP